MTVGIDTSGVSLHKRGYREVSGKAPITETLAAALIMLTPWQKDQYSGRSVLRKWNISDRSGDDRGKYRAGNESVLYGRRMDEPDSEEDLV